MSVYISKKKYIGSVFSGDPINAMAECKDINPQWPGLTVNLLFDIFGVHKALIFGQLQRTEYPYSEFMQNVNTAEETVFEETICNVQNSEHFGVYEIV